MKFSPQFRMNLVNVVIITICFVMFSVFLAFYNIAMINSPFSSGPSEIFYPRWHIRMNIWTGLVAGILTGVIGTIVTRRLFRKRSYMYGMLMTLAAYVFFFTIVTFIITSSNVLNDLGEEAFSMDGLIYGLSLVLDPITILYFIMWGVVVLFTLFLLQVNDKFGPGILSKFLLGKYHKPRKEERIFMFLDMRSSTMIAEKIGNEKYFNLLRDLFTDITNTILDNNGDIYQYVGDEIVISWPIKKGIKNANCIKCFLEIRQELTNLGDGYRKKYGLSPELKAGIYHGEVVAGEVGMIKKDIIYSGDVLNTTSRIQEQCNNFGVDLLISKLTFDLIPESSTYELIPLGSIELRGKARKIDLNTIREV